MASGGNPDAKHDKGSVPSRPNALEAQRTGGHGAGHTGPGCSSVCGRAGRLRGDLGWGKRGGSSSLVCQERRQGVTHTVWLRPAGGTRYHSRLTDEETEARGRARKAGLPAAVEGCPPDFRLSQCGDPKAPVARRGAAPAVSMAGEEKAAGREERGADVWADAATCQQNRHSSSRC